VLVCEPHLRLFGTCIEGKTPRFRCPRVAYRPGKFIPKLGMVAIWDRNRVRGSGLQYSEAWVTIGMFVCFVKGRSSGESRSLWYRGLGAAGRRGGDE